MMNVGLAYLSGAPVDRERAAVACAAGLLWVRSLPKSHGHRKQAPSLRRVEARLVYVLFVLERFEPGRGGHIPCRLSWDDALAAVAERLDPDGLSAKRSPANGKGGEPRETRDSASKA